MHDAAATFEASLDSPAPPTALEGRPALLGLWHAGRGAWDEAHELVQHEPDPGCAWVHAWLHRQEGDLPNAAYWYRRAGRPAVDAGDLMQEWRAIAAALLAAR